MASKHRDRIVRIAVIVIVVVLAVRGWKRAADSNDFGVFHKAGHAVATGSSPYEIVHEESRDYIYPPTLAILVAPLGLLPHDVAAALWIVGMFVALGVSFVMLLRLVRPLDRREGWWIGVTALLIAGRAIDSEMANGQANHLVLLGLVLGVVALVANRPAWGGAAFAAAAAFKLSPGLFAVWLLATRRWRAFAGFVAAFVALVVLLPVVVWGPSGTVEEYGRLEDKLAGRYDAGGDDEDVEAHVPGYSLRALVFHLTTDVQAVSHSGGRDIRINVIDGSDRLAGAIYWIVVAIVFVLSMRAIERRGSASSPGRVLFDASVVATVMVLVAPMTRGAHMVVLLMPAFVAAAVWVRTRTRFSFWWVLLPTLLTFGTSRGLIGKAASTWARALGTLTFGMLALWIGALIFARRDRFGVIDRTEPTTESSA